MNTFLLRVILVGPVQGEIELVSLRMDKHKKAAAVGFELKDSGLLFIGAITLNSFCEECG